MRGYYNTNRERNPVLMQSQLKALSQQEIILLSFMKSHTPDSFTPDEIHEIIFIDNGTPPTSVRRAITNLTNAGHLVKTDKKRMGRYGKMVHTWRYNADDE